MSRAGVAQDMQSERFENRKAHMKDGCHGSIKVLLALVLVVAVVWVAPATTGAAAPAVTLSPESGPIGTKVTVCVHNMTPGNTVGVGNITFGGAPWNTQAIQIDSAGCVCASMLTVPVAAVGPTAVIVSDGNLTAAYVFTVTQPNITISPTSGYRGQTVTVTGSKWPQRTPGSVSLTFGGSFIMAATPNSSGAFSVRLTVPLTAEASNLIGATDILGNAAPAQIFTVGPAALTVSPVSGLPGTSVKVTGVGFEPQSYVEEVKIAHHNMGPPGLMTNAVGTFTTTITVPGLPGGGQVVSATVAGLTLTTCFTIIDPDVWVDLEEDPPILVEDALASIGDKVIRVWGFYAGQWQMYDPSDSLGSDLTGLMRGRAYWIKVSEDCTLIFRQLRAGWNNIGW